MTRANFSAAVLAFLALCASGSAWPAPDHVVIVVEENKSYEQIVGNGDAPYINALAKKGALFTRSYAVAHPSQPNYLALFSGDTHGVVDDRCPVSVSGENLASELVKKGLSFRTYSESMPSPGYAGCAAGHYMRKHNPAANWQGINVTPEMNLPFTAFERDYSKLPTVSIVVPDQLNDMHDGEPLEAIARGDQWLKEHIDPYVRWAEGHNSLLILTWDEDDDTRRNHIATIFVGPMVKPGTIGTKVDHYTILRTLSDAYGLEPVGQAAARTPVRSIWKR
ncbi:MAG TPA: alkaline phosphatase family protein [Vicinamibacterales bacterium]|nr:alkaline phosphatase family protein [Vicinamibacterales bacterium]